MSSLKKNPKTQQIKSKFGLKQEKEKSEYTEKYCDVDAFYRFKDIAQSLRVTESPLEELEKQQPQLLQWAGSYPLVAHLPGTIHNQCEQ